MTDPRQLGGWRSLGSALNEELPPVGYLAVALLIVAAGAVIYNAGVDAWVAYLACTLALSVVLVVIDRRDRRSTP